MAKTLDEYLKNLKDVTEIKPEYEIPSEVPTIEQLLEERDKAHKADDKAHREAVEAGKSLTERVSAGAECWTKYMTLVERRIAYIVGQELPRLTSDKKEVKLYTPAVEAAVLGDCMDPRDIVPGIVNVRYLEYCRTNYAALRAEYKRLTDAGDIETPIKGAALRNVYSAALTYYPGDVWTKKETHAFLVSALTLYREDKRLEGQQKPPRTARVAPRVFRQPNSVLHNMLRYGEDYGDNGRPIITGIPEVISTGKKSTEYIAVTAEWDEEAVPEILHRDTLTPIQETVLEGYANALFAKLPESARKKLEAIEAGGAELIPADLLRGGRAITMSDIYTAQAPDRRELKPDSPALKELENAIKPLLSLGMELDITEQFRGRGLLPAGVTELTVNEPYIDARTGTATRGGKKEFVLYPNSIPVDYRYTFAVKNMISTRPEVLNIQSDGPQGWTQCKLDLEKISIRNYLQKEVYIYKNQKTSHPHSKSNRHNILLFEKIWKKSCNGISNSSMEEHRRREWVETCLIYWQHIGFIDNYEPYKGSTAGGRPPVLGFMFNIKN